MLNERPAHVGADELYLDLAKRMLSGSGGVEQYRPLQLGGRVRLLPGGKRLGMAIERAPFQVVRRAPPVRGNRTEGRDWPLTAKTMIGLRRLDNIQACVRSVLDDKVPGDLIETGVWRGGASIFMRAVLKVYDDDNRTVWLADSFAGLPKPNPKAYPADRGDRHWEQPGLTVTVDEVKSNFAEYGLLDDRVKFLEGWFKDTLPRAPIADLAVLRLDGDMYESTMDALKALYPKVRSGGYVIVDDWGAVPACKQAVVDYRNEQGVEDPIQEIDWTGVFWRRS